MGELTKSIKIGAYKFGENCISLSSDKEGVSSYKNYLGLLGSEFINRFNIILDYKSKKLFLKPNHLFSKKFLFPVSGIKLRSENAQIIISDVIKTTEAYQKGLRKSQKIISVNGDKTLNLELYRSMLEKENSFVNIEYLTANGKSKIIRVRLKRLL